MTTRHVTDLERRRRLGERHRLIRSRRSDDVREIADSVVALHSSDPVTVYLSAMVRMESPSVDAVDTALHVDRSVIRHHAMRRTIWVMSPEVTIAANASSTRKVAAAERRKLLTWLAASDVVDDPVAWLDAATEEIVATVTRLGPIPTRELGVLLPHLTIPLTVPSATGDGAQLGAHTRVALLAAFEGRLVRGRQMGGWTSGQYTWVATETWVDGLDLTGLEPTVAAASAVLVARLLLAYGPITATDVQWWTGWTKSQTGAALAAAAAVEVGLDGGGTGWLAPDDETPAAEEPWVALLPGLDPTAMGWKQREWTLDDDIAVRVFDRSGNAGPTVWVDGRIIGGWAQRRDGEIVLELMREIGSDQRAALDTEIERLTAAIGPTRFTLRFPSPSSRDLTA